MRVSRASEKMPAPLLTRAARRLSRLLGTIILWWWRFRERLRERKPRKEK
jgi:hypothetical protein